jgi:hypothetical protein
VFGEEVRGMGEGEGESNTPPGSPRAKSRRVDSSTTDEEYEDAFSNMCK